MQSVSKYDDATSWIARLTEPYPSAEIWASFTAWLAVDPANAAAYQVVAKADDALSTTLMVVSRSLIKTTGNDNSHFDNDNEPVWTFRRRARGMVALAASAAFALFGAYQFQSPARIDTFTTRPGEHRQIALNDGSSITLNGGSRLTLDRTRDRQASLEAGEAIFTIRHDPANPFRLKTAGGDVTDVGTVFNVRLDDRRVEVGVQEGAVRFVTGSRATPVGAGYALTFDINDRAATVAKREPQSIGGWRTGVLDYKGVRLGAVALDLSRSLGVPVKVSDDIADRRFSGVIQTGQDHNALFRSLEPLLGARATLTAAGWTLTR